MSFDPEAFKHVTIEESLDTEIVPPDEGVYGASVRDWNLNGGTSEKGNDWARLDVIWELEDPDGSQKQKTGRDTVTARQGIFLDLTDDGQLDTAKGRNVNLGRLREALGLNDRAFSFDMLDGQKAKVQVRHRTTDNGTFAEVRNVAHVDADVS